ncbi:hypothetical protein Tco_0924487 [Tanacetum coccineum]|uniref:Uncharacterized protein n=1 Tax=Tanacetum coccineum TaxID=301880 RepID=A0ABQ5D678_9ASTR
MTHPKPALHPIDVENYDASHSDDEDEAEKDFIFDLQKVVAISDGLKAVLDGLQIVVNYDVNVDIRWCRRRNFVLKDEVCFQTKLKKMKKVYEKIIRAYYNKQAGGLDSLTLNNLYDEGAYRAFQQPVYGSPAPNQFEAAGPFGMPAPAGQMTLFQANPSSV